MIHCYSWEAPSELNNVCALTTTESTANIWYHLNAFKPPVASAAVCSKAVIMLLLVYCLLLLPLFVTVLCLVLVLLFSTLCPSSVAIILMRKKELVALL